MLRFVWETFVVIALMLLSVKNLGGFWDSLKVLSSGQGSAIHQILQAIYMTNCILLLIIVILLIRFGESPKAGESPQNNT